MDASAIDIPKGYEYMQFDTFDRAAGPPFPFSKTDAAGPSFPFSKTELTHIWRPN